MNKTILVTRPNHDSTTDYLYYWTKPVLEMASKRGFKILDLDSKKANRKSFESYLESNTPGFIFLNGHGSEDKIAGYNDEVLLDEQTIDSKKLLNTILYSRSCRSALIFGRMAILKGGAKAFVGYSRDFVFLIDKNFITRPYLDQIAQMFLEPSNLVSTTIIKGHSVGEADKRSRFEMRKALFRSLSSAASELESMSAPFLLSNISSQTVWGDASATL